MVYDSDKMVVGGCKHVWVQATEKYDDQTIVRPIGCMICGALQSPESKKCHKNEICYNPNDCQCLGETNKWRSKAQMRQAKIDYIVVELKELAMKQNIDEIRKGLHALLVEIT